MKPKSQKVTSLRLVENAPCHDTVLSTYTELARKGECLALPVVQFSMAVDSPMGLQVRQLSNPASL